MTPNKPALIAAKLEIEAFAPRRGGVMDRTADDVLRQTESLMWDHKDDIEPIKQAMLADILSILDEQKSIGSTRRNVVFTYKERLISRTKLKVALQDYFMGGEMLGWIMATQSNSEEAQALSNQVATRISGDEAKQKIIVAMYGADQDLYYPYGFFEAETGLDRTVLKPAMTSLREAGIMDFARGLMTEDGEVAGSGFGIKHYALFKEAYAVVTPIHKTEDAFRHELDELIRDMGIEYYQRKRVRGAVIRFIESHTDEIQAIYGVDTKGIDLRLDDPESKVKA